MTHDTRRHLSSLGYEYYWYEEGAEEPETVEVRFSDLVPAFKDNPVGHTGLVADKRLYKHQWEAYQELGKGRNVILISGTGSGKTEAWLLHVLTSGKQALAVYPTLALANDQIRRIKDYAASAGVKVTAIDAKRRNEYFRKKSYGSSALKKDLLESLVVVTNPAFLLQDLKRWAVKPSKSLFYPLLSKIGLIVLDEFDFYGPREIALLLSMLRIIKTISGSAFQVAVLTATLGNPEELSEMLSEITGLETAVIGGKPFRVPNRVIVVLGKDLRKLWEAVRAVGKPLLESPNVGSDVKKALSDYEEFRKEVFKVVTVAESLGLNVPKPHVDVFEVLSPYLGDEGVTLVFTRSIAKAEELARKVRMQLPEDKRQRVATHHHLVSKAYREEVEKGAREGRVKLIFTPRTLSQGIDIGTVVRIVHYGLPDDVREFRQREGRKGRRKEIGFTETVILPATRWDRELISRGVEALRKWIELPLEQVVVEKGNKYSLLFEALYKAVSPSLRPYLTEEESELLTKLGLLRGGELTRRGKLAWQKMNFYEYSPPYGIKRVKVVAGREEYLEDISFCDLVEKFQPGCFDYTSDGVVVTHKLGGKGGRVVRAVVEEPIRFDVIAGHDAMAYALEEYEKAKRRWGETPRIVADYMYGRLHSEVICVVRVPLDGFGIYTKIPNRVLWILQGERGRPVVAGDKTLLLRDRHVITVPTATYGRYDDYTYGLSVELEPDEDLTLLRIGLAFISVVLRRVYRIPFETIMYELSRTGEGKLMILHEPESAGLLEKMDWAELRRTVATYEPDDLDEILLKVVDEDAHVELVSRGLDWELARAAALRAIDYILVKEKVAVIIKGKTVFVPKPSPALKLLSMSAVRLPLDDEEKVCLTGVAVFDGEEAKTTWARKEYYLVDEEGSLVTTLGEYFDKGYRLLVYDYESLVKSLEGGGLKSAAFLIAGLRSAGLLIDVHEEVSETLSLKTAPLEEVLRGLGWELNTPLSSVLYEHENSRRAIRDKPMRVWFKFTRYLREKAEAYLKERAESIYKLHLALKQIKENQ